MTCAPYFLALLCLLPSAAGLTAQIGGRLSQPAALHETAAAQGLLPSAQPLGAAAGAAAGHGATGHAELEGLHRPRRAASELPGRAFGPEPPLTLLERQEKAGPRLNLTGSLDCIENNGGSCVIQECYSWRGSQTCHLGRCFCTGGQCAGTDGRCHREQNVLLASRIRLRNVRFPQYLLYMSNFNFELWVGNTPGDQADFELRQLPSGGYASDPVDFLMTSSRYTGYAVTLRETQSCDSDGGSCTTKIQGGSEHIVFPMDKGIQFLALNFERIPERPDAVMIGSYMYPRTHLYVPQTGWQVSTYDNDPGTGGYWTFEPPLSNETMERLRFYHGPRCTWFCGLGCSVAPGGLVLLLLAVTPLSSLH